MLSAPEFMITDKWSCQLSPFPAPPPLDNPTSPQAQVARGCMQRAELGAAPREEGVQGTPKVQAPTDPLDHGWQRLREGLGGGGGGQATPCRPPS